MLGDFSFILKQQQVHNPTPTPPCPNPIGVYSNSYQISIPVWAKKEVRRAAPICTRELMEWVCWWGGMKCQPSFFPLGGQQKRFHKGSSWLALSQMGLPGGKNTHLLTLSCSLWHTFSAQAQCNMQGSHSVVQASKASCQSHPALNPLSATHHNVSTLKTARRLTSQIFSRLTVHKYIKSLWLYFNTVYFDTHPASCNWRERKRKKKAKGL